MPKAASKKRASRTVSSAGLACSNVAIRCGSFHQSRVNRPLADFRFNMVLICDRRRDSFSPLLLLPLSPLTPILDASRRRFPSACFTCSVGSPAATSSPFLSTGPTRGKTYTVSSCGKLQCPPPTCPCASVDAAAALTAKPRQAKGKAYPFDSSQRPGLSRAKKPSWSSSRTKLESVSVSADFPFSPGLAANSAMPSATLSIFG